MDHSTRKPAIEWKCPRGRLAQLVRAPALQAGGPRFEPATAHHVNAMSDEENGHGKSSLDRLEEFTEILLQEHITFAEEHKKLLTAQVVLNDQLQEIRALQNATDARLAESYARLAESTRHTDERMNALIAVVDGLIRKQPPPQ